MMTNDEQSSFRELSETLDNASAAIDREDATRQQIVAAQRQAESRHVYSTATTELARDLRNKAETLARLISEDEEEMRIIDARRLDRFEAHEAIMRTLAGLQA